MFQGNVNVTCIILLILYIKSRHEYKILPCSKPTVLKRKTLLWRYVLRHCAMSMTEKTICRRELHKLSALYAHIINEHEIEC